MRPRTRAHWTEPPDREEQGYSDAGDRRRRNIATGARRLREGRMSEPTLAADVALVTGASRGIGRAIAAELARNGATVIGTATSETGAQAISEWLSQGGHKGRGIVLNVSQQESVD